MALASGHQIRVDLSSYPSVASVHFDGVQEVLVAKAIKQCGSTDKVVGFSSINIEIKTSVSDPVAVLAKDDNGTKRLRLELWYPKIDVTANLQCLD